MKKFVVFLLIISSLLTGCSTDFNNKYVQMVKGAISSLLTDLSIGSNNKYVQMVKGGHPNSWPNITYEAAFSAFFGSPEWKYFKTKDGKKIVEFTGKCTYHDVPVNALLQFIVDEQAGTFEAAHLSFNEVPQNKLICLSLIEKAFDEYAAEKKKDTFQKNSATSKSSITTEARDANSKNTSKNNAAADRAFSTTEARDVYVGTYSDDGSDAYIMTQSIHISSRTPYTFTCTIKATGDLLKYKFYPKNGKPYYENSEGYHAFVFGGQSPVAENIYRYVTTNY